MFTNITDHTFYNAQTDDVKRLTSYGMYDATNLVSDLIDVMTYSCEYHKLTIYCV